MQVVRILKWELTSLRLEEDSFVNDKSILESLKNKQNLIIISIFKNLRKLNKPISIDFFGSMCFWRMYGKFAKWQKFNIDILSVCNSLFYN